MSARFLVSAVVGVAVGYFFGPQAGFQAAALTYGVTAGLDPNKQITGPRLDDLKRPTADEGSAIPYIQGAWRTAGSYIWCSDKHEIAHEETQGKGGPGVDSTTFTYTIDCMILCSINPLAALRRVWSNGKLIWSRAVDDEDSLQESDDTIYWEDIRFYGGALDQMPDPDYEAAVGAGNAPAYRGRATIFIKGLNLGGSGQLPILTFEVVSEADLTPSTGNVIFQTRYLDGDPVDEAYTHSVPTVIGTAFVGDDRMETGVVTDDSPAAGCMIYQTSALNHDPSRALTFEFHTDWRSLANTSNTLIVWGLAGDTSYEALSWYGMDGVIGYHANDVTPGVNTAPMPDPPPGYNGPPHVAMVIPAGTNPTIRIYLMGSLAMTIAHTESLSVGDGIIKVGSINNNDALHDQNYWITNVRVTKGERYVENFIPPESLPALSDVDIVTPINPRLDQVVQRICERTGLLDEFDLDVTGLEDDHVRGMAVTSGTSRQAIETLASAYLFEATEDAVLKFVKRGGAPVATIPYTDLGASFDTPGEPFPKTRANDMELPARVSVKYANAFNDYQDGSAAGDRLVTESTSVQAIEIPLALSPLEAAKIADTVTMDLQTSLVAIGPVSLSNKHAALEPTDVLIVQGKDGSSFRCRVMKLTDAGGTRSLEMLLDDSSVIDSNADADNTDQSTLLVRAVSTTSALLIDGPIGRDADNDAGFYLMAKPSDPSKAWGAGVIYTSPDGVAYTRDQSVTERAKFGPCLTTLGDWTGPRVFDMVNSVRVNVGAGVTLSSSTRDAVLDDQMVNAFAIGSPARGWEYGQFITATLVADGVYDLSGFLRGSRGTEWATVGHQANETFALLTLAGTRRVLVENGQIGQERLYKVPTSGKSLASATQIAFTDNAVGLKPFSPFDARMNDDGTDVTITWQRRTRLQVRTIGPMGISVPLGEEIEAYAVDILAGDSDPTVLRTILTSTTQAVYTAAMQAEDGYTTGDPLTITIQQISATVGRGYPLEATL